MKKIRDFLKNNVLAVNLVLVAALVALVLHIYTLLTALYLTVEFKEMRPIHERVDVYFKGIKVGKVRRFDLCHDCKSTHIKIMLDYKGLKLPINTAALFKKELKNKKEFDFIELVYPKEPSQFLLSDGDVITGKATTDVDSFLANQDPDSLEHIRQNLENSSVNLESTISSLGDLFLLLQDVINENKGNIHSSTDNLMKTTQNVNEISSKFDKALKQKSLDNSVSNVESALSDVRRSAENLNVVSENINSAVISVNEAMPMVDSALCQANGFLGDLKEITCAIKEKMKKPFGSMRILFGKTIEADVDRGCRR